MKNLTLLFIFLLSLNLVKGQDVGISGEYIPFSIHQYESSALKVNFSNGDFIPYPIGEVYVKVSIPTQYYSSSTPTGDFMNYFANFNDDDGDGVWFGFNTAVIPANLSGGFVGATLFIQVTGVNIALNPGLSTIFDTDFENIYDDQYPLDNITYAGLVVTAPLPVKLLSFSGKSKSCDEIDLSWVTASEYNSEYFEVERSVDGRQFLPVQKVKSQNILSGSKYNFTDKDVSGGSKYYYRLRQVDFDGKSEHLKLISVETQHCSGGALSMELHPNPAVEKVFVSLDGFNENDNVTLVVTNAIGEKVMTLKNALIGAPNEVKLNNLPAGIYNVKIAGFDEVTSKRFIKID